MKAKRYQYGRGFFYIGIGMIMIAAGGAWLLQAAGMIPEGIRVLQYACPACVILVGLRMVTYRLHGPNQNGRDVAEDGNGTM